MTYKKRTMVTSLTKVHNPFRFAIGAIVTFESNIFGENTCPKMTWEFNGPELDYLAYVCSSNVLLNSGKVNAMQFQGGV